MNKAQTKSQFIKDVVSKLSDEQLALTAFIGLQRNGLINSNMSQNLFAEGLAVILDTESEKDIAGRMVSINASGIHLSEVSSFFSINEQDLFDFVTSNLDDVVEWVQSVKQPTDGFDLTHRYTGDDNAQQLAMNTAHLLQHHVFDNEGDWLFDDFIYGIITGNFSVACSVTRSVTLTGSNDLRYDAYTAEAEKVIMTLARLILKSIASGWIAVTAGHIIHSEKFPPFKLNYQ